MLTLRKRTQNKNAQILNSGFNLEEVYECDLKENKDFQNYFKTWYEEYVGYEGYGGYIMNLSIHVMLFLEEEQM